MSDNKFDRDKFVQLLKQKNADRECHRCGNKNFVLLNGYTYMPFSEDRSSINLGGPNIPAVLVVCSNCGAITPHALGAFENLGTDGK